MIRYQILGQSNYAVAIILDTLRRIHGGGIAVDIVGNVPPEENDSLAHAYAVEGVEANEVFHLDWRRDTETPLLMGSIGRSRESIFRFFLDKYECGASDYENTVDPRANTPFEAEFGRGIHVSPGATIAPHAKLADFVVINRNASVGHHTILEEFATLNPGANVAGVCRIGRGTTIGAGATVVDQIIIGQNTIIGAGSVVTGDIPADVVAYGVPAKVVRNR
jgi:sugar O-acyltransferase (sialic acid O-acetyltransferase NeuD family)